MWVASLIVSQGLSVALGVQGFMTSFEDRTRLTSDNDISVNMCVII